MSRVGGIAMDGTGCRDGGLGNFWAMGRYDCSKGRNLWAGVPINAIK